MCPEGSRVKIRQSVPFTLTYRWVLRKPLEKASQMQLSCELSEQYFGQLLQHLLRYVFSAS